MHIALIVAASENNVIGSDNQLPWHLSEDLKYFKRVTLGKPVIMGRKTYESIGRPLPGRANIVVTRQSDWQVEGVEVVHDIDQALQLAKTVAQRDGVDEVMVIGGAQIYNECFAKADRLYLTRVHAEVEGDAFLPTIDPADWRELRKEKFNSADAKSYDYTISLLERTV